MKGLYHKRIALKVDVIGPENILLAGTSVHLSTRNVLQAVGNEGAKAESGQLSLTSPSLGSVSEHTQDWTSPLSGQSALISPSSGSVSEQIQA